MHDGTTALILLLKKFFFDDFESDVIAVMLEKSKKMRDPNQR
jgi:hypothetical protein